MVKLNILIAGVGGQGVVLASDILGEVALESDLDVKKTDTLGMAQRGGSVVTHLRIGEEVASPLIAEGEADYLLAFEKLEAARWSGYLRPRSFAIVNDLAIPPQSVRMGSESYPEDEEITHLLRRRAVEVMLVEGSRRAAEMGNSKVLNILMLGALSMMLPFNPETWEKVMARRLPPKILDLNLAAFKQGRHDMLTLLSVMPGEPGCATETHDDDCGCQH
jgi:indolepyruvate ferredoxin oxidoreductase, beta subunit